MPGFGEDFSKPKKFAADFYKQKIIYFTETSDKQIWHAPDKHTRNLNSMYKL